MNHFSVEKFKVHLNCDSPSSVRLLNNSHSLYLELRFKVRRGHRGVQTTINDDLQMSFIN